MSYFPNAFKKIFILNDFFYESGDTSTLSGASCGFYDPKTWQAIPTAQASISQHPHVVLVSGSSRSMAMDKIGSHGGYTESIKSQIIDPQYVHRFWKVTGQPAQAHIVRLGWDGTNATTAPKFYCGQDYQFRIDIKGSPALRLVDHNIYHIFDVKTQCCIGNTTSAVDPVAVLLNLAAQINQSATASKFIAASVVNSGGIVNPDTYVTLTDPTAIANATAAIVLTAAYSDTQFFYCSFDPRDHYELEPVIIASAQLIDNTGDPCSLSKQIVFTQVQAPLGTKGSTSTILRDVILQNEYRQDPFPWDARRKEIFNFTYQTSGIGPGSYYDSYYILHSTPRHNNPSGTFDNDLYLLHICGEGVDYLSSLADWFTAYLNSAGSTVALEDLS